MHVVLSENASKVLFLPLLQDDNRPLKDVTEPKENPTQNAKAIKGSKAYCFRKLCIFCAAAIAAACESSQVR